MQIIAGTASDPEQQIIRNVEAELAAPHQLGCFETYADQAAEAGLTGEYDEVLPDGRNLMGHFHSDVERGGPRCECQDIPDDEEE